MSLVKSTGGGLKMLGGEISIQICENLNNWFNKSPKIAKKYFLDFFPNFAENLEGKF